MAYQVCEGMISCYILLEVFYTEQELMVWGVFLGTSLLAPVCTDS